MSFDRNLLPDPTAYFQAQDLTLYGPRSSIWKTTECKFHGSTDSLRINTVSGGWICMSCGIKGGDVLAYHMAANDIEFIPAAKELGAWVDDGKPFKPQKPTPLPARAALQVMAFESTLVAVAAGNVANGVILSEVDRFRLFVAAGRIARLMECFA
jgi:hypothetical protein